MNNFEEIYNKRLSEINNRLRQLLPPPTYGEDIVWKAMTYSLENGGKRIRPVIVLETCKICGGNPEAALNFACALEMIHTYSLIHDDLPCMDDDDMRRGKPACHIAFGEEYALLAGDGLLTAAFEVLASSDIEAEKIVRAVKSLSDNAGYAGMIGGQVVDLRSEGKAIDFDRLNTMHSLKTGALIRCAAELGCICAGADEKKKKCLVSYAHNLGLAFQIVDDILDVIGDETELGKPVGSDAQCDKTTFVTLFGLEKARQMAIETTEKAKKSLEYFEDNRFLLELADKLTTRKS